MSSIKHMSVIMNYCHTIINSYTFLIRTRGSLGEQGREYIMEDAERFNGIFGFMIPNTLRVRIVLGWQFIASSGCSIGAVCNYEEGFMG